MSVNGEPLIVYADAHARHPRAEDDDVADPLTPAEDEAFPALTARQIERIAPLARERDLADGESLWAAGDCDRPPRMTTSFAPALRMACRSEAMSATLQALPATALPVRRDLTQNRCESWSRT